jgi:adenosylmethionine-8-amino-7-oxononanoate aminotransferase
MARDARMSGDGLQRTALDHLWLHFTHMGAYADPADLQVMVRGDGCYLEDSTGRRYLDALAGLFCVNIGYGFGEEMGEAAATQMRELPFAINWTFAHPRSIELAAELAALAPGDLSHSFFVSGGSEAVEAAWKLARQYHAARGERRWKVIARRVAYHGDLRGAGFFYALELVKDKDTRTIFSREECDRLLRGFLSPRLFERGLLCRADDRGDPVVQISPPLVARQEQFDEIAEILGGVLDEASDRMAVAT